MAKFILSLFGGLSILIGFIIISLPVLVAALSIKDPEVVGLSAALSFWFGAGFLLAGAPLLAIARIIELLEQLVRNTGIPQAPRRDILSRYMNSAEP